MDRPDSAPEARYLTLADAAKLLSNRPHQAALYRWCRHGLRSANGGRVFLRHIRLGKSLYTTKEWLQEFGEARTADQSDASTPPTDTAKRSLPRKRLSAAKRRDATDEAELERAGI